MGEFDFGYESEMYISFDNQHNMSGYNYNWERFAGSPSNPPSYCDAAATSFVRHCSFSEQLAPS